MRGNKVTNILFIVFTVMALAGTASLVKTDRRAGTCAGRQ